MARPIKNAAARPAVLGMSGLLVALSVEFVDELVDGTKGAALPLIRIGLGLTYSQIGLLAAVPLLVGGLLELPFGLLAGGGPGAGGWCSAAVSWLLARWRPRPPPGHSFPCWSRS